MRITSDPEARIRYLSLALFCEEVIDALLDLLQQDRPVVPPSLNTALNWLRAAIDQPDLIPEAAIRALSNYEQVRTLEELRPDFDARQMIPVLEKLLQHDLAFTERRQGAQQAMNFFQKLEKEALRNFDQPVEGLPHGILALAK